MKKYSIIFFIRQSLNGLMMNSVMSITSVFILMSCLILTGCFTLLMLNVELNLEQLNTLNKITFQIDKAYDSEEEIERIKEEIRQLDNVKSIKFVSKEEALNSFREEYGVYSSLFDENEALFNDVIKDNPIDNAIEIEYKDIDDVNTLVYQLSCIEGNRKIKNQVQIAELIKNLKNIVMLVLMGFLAISFVLAVFIILNTVRLSVHSRKEEIIIMRYIGATNSFILIPFLLEGVIIGIIAGIIAYTAQWYIYRSAVVAIIKMNAGLKFIAFSDVNILLFCGFILTGVLCGLLGSGLSSRKYLKA